MTRQTATLIFDLDQDWLQSFAPLLRWGFTRAFRSGQSLKDLLLEAGVPADYIEDRLQTVFLNGSPADSLDMPLFGSGHRLALSAAMPGLFGASMRRGGYYAGMRESISCRAPSDSIGKARGAEGQVFIRLLNFTAPEIGPFFLRQGVGLQTGELAAWLAEQPAGFWEACRSVRAGGGTLQTTAPAVMGWLEGRGEVELQVTGHSSE